ncbi:MAG: type II toxin-antitoxin system RelE/ParE family toxin, partial [Clostridia bacterium]
MNYNIIITNKASSDIDEIAAFVFQASASAETTRKFINNIYEKIEILADFPNSGNNPRNRALLTEGYKFLVFEKYLIFYRLENDAIYISSVF